MDEKERRTQARHDLFIVFLTAVILTLMILIRTGKLAAFEWYVPFKDMQVYFYPLLVLALTVIVARFASKFLTRYFYHASKHIQVERTRYALFTQLIVVLIYLVGIGTVVYLIPGLRSLSLSLFAGAGVLAIVVGFATQKTLGNLVSGVMIAVYRPYRIGDKITLGDEYGTVEDITLRHTVINTWDNRRLIVPNSVMDDERINNYTIEDPKILGHMDFGISYDSDIDLARKIMKEEATKHPDFLDNRDNNEMLAGAEPVKVRVVAHSDSSITLRLYFWAADQPTRWRMGCDLLESIKKRFDKEGVEIPFPYRTVVYKKDIAKPKRLKQ